MLVAAMLVGAVKAADKFGDIDMETSRYCGGVQSAQCNDNPKCRRRSTELSGVFAGCIANNTSPIWAWTHFQPSTKAKFTTALNTMLTGKPSLDKCSGNATDVKWVTLDYAAGGPLPIDGAEYNYRAIAATNYKPYGWSLKQSSPLIYDGIEGLGVVCTYPADYSGDIGVYDMSGLTAASNELQFMSSAMMFPGTAGLFTGGTGFARRRRASSTEVALKFSGELAASIDNVTAAASVLFKGLSTAGGDDESRKMWNEIYSFGVVINGKKMLLDLSNPLYTTPTAPPGNTRATKVVSPTGLSTYVWPPTDACPCAYNIFKRPSSGGMPTCSACPAGQINNNNTCVDEAELNKELKCGSSNGTETAMSIPNGNGNSCQPVQCYPMSKDCDIVEIGATAKSDTIRAGSPACDPKYWSLSMTVNDGDGDADAELRMKRGDDAACDGSGGVGAVDSIKIDDNGAYISKIAGYGGATGLSEKCKTIRHLVDARGNDMYPAYAMPGSALNESHHTTEAQEAHFAASKTQFIENIALYWPDDHSPRRARRSNDDSEKRRLRMTSRTVITVTQGGREFTFKVDTWYAPPWGDGHGSLCALVIDGDVDGDADDDTRVMTNTEFPGLITCSDAGWSGSVTNANTDDLHHHKDTILTFWETVAVAVVVMVALGLMAWGAYKVIKRRKMNEQGSMAVPFL